MAFVSNMDDEENQGKAPSQGVVAPIGGTGSVHLAPSSGVGAAAAPGSTSGGTPSNAGGSFATLQTYLGANQGQAPALANNIVNNVDKQYQTLDQGNNSTLSGIQDQVTAGFTPENNDAIAAEAANPVSFASDPNNVSAFQGQLTDQYKGPASAESDAKYQTQSAAVNNALATGNSLVSTDAGRQQLLQQNEAAPTAGVTALNSAILSQDPNSQSKIEGAYQPFNNLVSNLSNGAQGIDSSITKDTAEASDANAKSNAQINSQVNGLNTTLNNTVNQDQTTQAQFNTDLTNFQNLWGPISTDINAYNEAAPGVTNLPEPVLPVGMPKGPGGSDPNGGRVSYGAIDNDLVPTLNESASNNVYTLQNVATPDQYAQANAYQTLMGSLAGMSTPAISGVAPTTAPLVAPNTFNAPVNIGTEAQTDLNNLLNSVKSPAISGGLAVNQGNAIKPEWNALIEALTQQGATVPGWNGESVGPGFYEYQ